MRRPAPWRSRRCATCSRLLEMPLQREVRGTAAARRRAPSSSSARPARRRCRRRRASDAGRRRSRAAPHRAASSAAGSMRGPQTATIRRPGHEPARGRLGGEHALEQVRADARAAHRDEADLLVLTPSELAPQRRALVGRWAASKPVMCPHEVDSAPRPSCRISGRPGTEACRRRCRRGHRRRSPGRARAGSAPPARPSRRCSRRSGRPRARRPRAAAGSPRSRSARRRARVLSSGFSCRK